MKKALFVAALLAASAGAALAMTAVEDADADGVYSMDEMVAAYPELTAEQFATIDADASGDVSADELVAAVEAGTLPN